VITTIDVLSAISDERSLLLFKTIAHANSERRSSEILVSTLNLRSKQYYSRMSSLIKAGLVKRQKGKYFVTTFGSVIFDAHLLLGNAVKYYWKLKAIDSLGVTNDSKMPKDQRKKIIEELIDNRQLKDISLSTKF